VAGLHAPVAAIQRLADDLASASDGAILPIVDRLRQATATLQAAMTGLPVPPAKGRR
jgi:hypothetical protein